MKAAFLFLRLLALLPHVLIRALAAVFGLLAYALVVPRRRVGLTNLRLCFPEWGKAEQRRVLRRHFYHMALLVLEYGLCWYGSAARLKNMVHYRDKHLLDEALARGEKVILLYPHFTAFEMAVYALNQDVPLISVYSRQKNQALDDQILQGRHRYGNVFLISRNDGLRSIIKQIKSSNAPFLYLPDQDFGAKDSVFARFFGVPAATITGLARIAKLTGAKVVPAIPRRLPDGRVELRFYPAWDDYPSADVLADTQRMNDFIAERVREQPEQYYWLHKRFKTRPEGGMPVYGSRHD